MRNWVLIAALAVICLATEQELSHKDRIRAVLRSWSPASQKQFFEPVREQKYRTMEERVIFVRSSKQVRFEFLISVGHPSYFQKIHCWTTRFGWNGYSRMQQARVHRWNLPISWVLRFIFLKCSMTQKFFSPLFCSQPVHSEQRRIWWHCNWCLQSG